MNPPPIGIITRDRVHYLDLTLRSVYGTTPVEAPLVVFDDASADRDARVYLYTRKSVALHPLWLNGKPLALQGVKARSVAQGLAGHVPVEKLAPHPLGVVGGSCAALRLLRQHFPDAPAYILLQDDVVFNYDWLPRLQEAEQLALARDPKPGLIAGLDINRKIFGEDRPNFVEKGGITAQCYYLTAAGMAALERFLAAPPTVSKGFDNALCTALRAAGLGVYLMNPAVGQHIGLTSLVRPGWRWTRFSKQGRIDVTAQGPFVVADAPRANRPQ